MVLFLIGDRFPAVEKENDDDQKKAATAKLAAVYAAKNPSKRFR